MATGVMICGGVNRVDAAELESATLGNYIAGFAHSETPTYSQFSIYKDDEKTAIYLVNDVKVIDGYNYKLTSVKLPDESYQKYWVREGYGVSASINPYFNGALDPYDKQPAIRIDAYKLSSSTSEAGLVFVGKNGLSDTEVTTAVNNDRLHQLNYNTYGAITNGGGTSTPSNWNYYILRDGEFKDVGGTYKVGNNTYEKLPNNFAEVEYNPNGYYQTKDTKQRVEFENVYNISFNGTNKVGVFLTEENGTEVYTGPVYGKHNEILVTAYDEGTQTWSTVWGAQITDPNATIGSMTVGQFNNILEDIHNEDVTLSLADVEKVAISGDSINLVNKKGNSIPGVTISRTADDDNGTDTVVNITDAEGNTISLETGSRVVASGNNNNLNKLSVNGVEWNIPQGGEGAEYTVTASDRSSSDAANVVKKYQLMKNGTAVDGSEIVDTDTKYKVVKVEGTNNQYKLVTENGEEVADSVVFTDNDTTYTAGKNLVLNGTEFATADNVEFTSVTTGNTVMNGNGITIGSGATAINVTANNISMGGHQIHNVAAGTELTDAVNVSQLNTAIGGIVDTNTTYTVSEKAPVTAEDADAPVGAKWKYDLVDSNNAVVGSFYDTDINNQYKIVKDGDNKYKLVDINAEGEAVEIVDNDTKYTAGKNLVLNGTEFATKDEVVFTKVTTGDTVMTSAGITVGSDVALGATGLTIQNGPSVTTSGIDAGGNKITGVAAGDINANSTDAINGSQLYQVQQKIEQTVENKTFGLTADQGEAVNQKLNGTIGIVGDDTNITTVAGNGEIQIQLEKDLNVDSVTTGNTSMSDSGITIKDADNNVAVTLTGEGLNIGDVSVTGSGINAGGNKITNVQDGTISADSKEAVNGSQLYQIQQTLGDGKFGLTADQGEAVNQKLNGTIGIVGDTNITTAADAANGEIQVRLNKDLKGLTGVETEKLTVAGNTTINEAGIVTNKVSAGNTTIDENGVKVGDKVALGNTGLTIGSGDSAVSVTEKGINAGGNKVTGVADGEISKDSTDAVNGSQLYATNQNIENIQQNLNSVNSRVDKVGAGAAALAALHPMDFDPDDKLSFAAGVGNYNGQNAAALGAFYRPDEKVMLSVGGTMGNGENMVNAGVSFALDRTNHVNNSKVAMAREIVDLKAQVAQLTALVTKLIGANETDNAKAAGMFPDVPENHWAYEYIQGLAQRGIIDGYPDGTFNGDRTMSRYEFATMLFKAMQNGAVLSEQIMQEFKPELGRIRVDRVKGADNDGHKIERVRVNGGDERDHYGNKISK